MLATGLATSLATRLATRCYSSRVDEVSVKCRSNGHVQLRIHRPVNTTVTTTTTNPATNPTTAHQAKPPILLYLPAGPVHPSAVSSHHDNDVAAALSAAAAAVVVLVDYRLDAQHPYPTPVHDVLTAYDWVLHHLAHSQHDARPQQKLGPVRRGPVRLGVCGELVGGSLAAMLALTECHMGSDRIVAAAVNNPIVDWLFPEAEDKQKDASQPAIQDGFDISPAGTIVRATAKSASAKSSLPTSPWHQHPAQTSALLSLRTAIFPSPPSYLDRFASPLHFFRSPSLSLTPALDDDDAASQYPYFPTNAPDDPEPNTSFLDRDYGASGAEPGATTIFQSESPPTWRPQRRAHRVYPPTGLGLRLPALSVSVGQDSVLRAQGEELVRLVRRSVVRYEVGKEVEDEAELERAASRVGMVLRPGRGLWTGEEREGDWEDEVGEVGRWFRGALRS